MSGQTHRILVVEDDESVRALAARALSGGGRMIDTAADGEEGLALIDAAAGGYDLVVSDIRMPALDGIAMAKAAAERYPDLKILLMTGYAEQRERAADLTNIIIDVLQKPFQLADLRSAVNSALA
ncbi:MAG: response regulator [Phyllobacteriaceae bacterium]|nr:response regulator [Phyllobacteriaceae bacterium]